MSCKLCEKNEVVFGFGEGAMKIERVDDGFQLWVNYDERLVCGKGWLFAFAITHCPKCGRKLGEDGR